MTVQVNCVNTGRKIEVPAGSDLRTVYELSGLDFPYGVVSAKVNNKVEDMTFRLYNDKLVEFLDVTNSSGQRTYTRSLLFVLAKAVEDIYPQARLRSNAMLSRGIKCDIVGLPAITEEVVSDLRCRMQQIIDADIPFERCQCTTDEAVAMFRERGHEGKARLLETTGGLYTNYYRLADSVNYFYGSLLLSTGQIRVFDLVRWEDGLLLRVPNPKAPNALMPLMDQPKTAEIFREHHRWQDIMGLTTVGDFNMACAEGRATEIINVAEALQAKKLAHIAEMIAARVHSSSETTDYKAQSTDHNVCSLNSGVCSLGDSRTKGCKFVLISGPSSSGKTTFSKRLCVQLMAEGIRPIPISTDDYVVNRVDTPLDENGEYDFEHIDAVDIPFFEQQLTDLLAGKAVELPEFNFVTGCRQKSGRVIQLTGNEVLIIEGLHTLNPQFTPHIPDGSKFKIFVSALTTILLDEHNLIPPTDNRLIRRILRDYKYRGFSALDTIKRWPSVLAGEKRWIEPFQENADVMFNSALLFELAVLRNHVTPVLEMVSERDAEYSEVRRLRRFLNYFTPVPDRQIPPTSLLREFVGGSSFKY